MSREKSCPLSKNISIMQECFDKFLLFSRSFSRFTCPCCDTFLFLFPKVMNISTRKNKLNNHELIIAYLNDHLGLFDHGSQNAFSLDAPVKKLKITSNSTDVSILYRQISETSITAPCCSFLENCGRNALWNARDSSLGTSS